MHQTIDAKTDKQRLATIEHDNRVVMFDPDRPATAWLSAAATLPAQQ